MDAQQLPFMSCDSDPEHSSDGSIPGSEEIGFGSELKRQKVEEVDGCSNDEVAGEVADEDDDEEEVEWVIEFGEPDEAGLAWTQTRPKPRIWYPKDVEGEQKLERFYEQIEESEGFDVDEVPPVDVLSSGVLPVDMECYWHGQKVKDSVDHVIREYNEAKKGVSELRLEKIEKANWGPCAGANYYITFEATDVLAPDRNGATKVYQAEVFRHVVGGVLSTTLFREKGQKEFLREMPGRPRTYA